MRNETEYGKCACVIGSMTQALRAQKVLAAAAIYAEVIKADPSESNRGCAYAISYACAQEQNVKQVLGNAGIRPRSYFRGGRP